MFRPFVFCELFDLASVLLKLLRELLLKWFLVVFCALVDLVGAVLR